jgi:hypothetical protein
MKRTERQRETSKIEEETKRNDERLLYRTIYPRVLEP